MKIFFAAIFIFILTACVNTKYSHKHVYSEPAQRNLSSKNWSAIKTLLRKYGNKSINYNEQNKPIAIFDWDNTVIKNDIADAMFLFMAQHGLFYTPKNWQSTSQFLSKSAILQLKKVCPITNADFLPSKQNKACADLLFSIYKNGHTLDKVIAFDHNYNKDIMEPSAAWAAQMFSGYKEARVKEITQEAINVFLNNPVAKDNVFGIRIYSAMKDLIHMLKENGFDIWVVSASSQYIVEPFAAYVGIASDHVIGIRAQLDSSHKITPYFIGCGPYKDKNQSIITYRQGKRCFINKIIFNISNPKEMMNLRSPTIFAAGDADSDIFFMKDALGLKLAIDRNAHELISTAHANQDGLWIISPMFIEP